MHKSAHEPVCSLDSGFLVAKFKAGRGALPTKDFVTALEK